MKRMQELEMRRKALVNYSNVQRSLVASNLTVLRRPLHRFDGMGQMLKGSPLTTLMSVGGVLLGGMMAKKVTKFSIGAWLGKKVLNAVGKKLFR